MNAHRPRPFLGSALFVAVLLFVVPSWANAFPVYTAYNVGTVSPGATQICGTVAGIRVPSGYTGEGAVLSISNPSAGHACATLQAGTTLTGNFAVTYSFAQGAVYFYGTAASPNAMAQPKFAIAGVFYAPPCSSGKSASSVVYGTSNQLKIDNSLTNEYTQSESVALSGSLSFVVDYVPISIGGALTYGWGAGTNSGTDVAVTTSTSESYTIDGCLGVDGINHVYDIIWVWLNPVLPYYIPPSTSSPIVVLGTGSDGRDPVSQQTKAPDVVPLSVIQIQHLITVLNANETPTFTNTGIETSTLQALQRTWDTTWVTNTGGEPGPGLVAADYEEILAADPFVATPSFNPASSSRYSLVQNAVVYYDATATPTETSYTGQAIDATAQTSGTDDQHYVSVEVSVTIGETTPAPFIGGEAKLDYTNKWLWDTKSQSTTTNTSTQTATFNIWNPAATYTGPDTLAVYWDTVYQTFVFYPL
jgi:hypothetical protein